MANFDFFLKLRGIEGFCGQEIENFSLGRALYGKTVDEPNLAQQISRLNAGVKQLDQPTKVALTVEMNRLIGQRLNHKDIDPLRGPLRPEDWDRSLPEFFSGLAAACRDIIKPDTNKSVYEARLDETHSKIVDALNGLSEFRIKRPDLVIDRAPLRSITSYRIPETAMVATTLDVPAVHLHPPELMTIALLEPVSSASQGWLFFIRNPDTHNSSTIEHRVWEEADVENLIFWMPSPFDLPAGFKGELPGFPVATRNLSGEMTAYLLIERLESSTVRTMLEEVGTAWDDARPNFDATVHLIARARTLFGVGNKSKTRTQAPPTLYARRYKVH